MRRKSERNKGKASPEKKVEKPTRKSTRRRGKKSPSTSPDRDNGKETTGTAKRENEIETTKQSRLPGRETEKINERAESNVTSSEIGIIKEEDEGATDAGSVWKVARADASPGEIQKLKLCRQRNMSETSDASSSRKRSNKWQEGGGESVTEEIDSADERTTVRPSRKTVDNAPTTDAIASVVQGWDSSEEVSDSKEFPPEIATAELSDVKPNIDDDVDQGETGETTIVSSANVPEDDKPMQTIPEPSRDVHESNLNENPEGDKNREENPKEDATQTNKVEIKEKREEKEAKKEEEEDKAKEEDEDEEKKKKKKDCEAKSEEEKDEKIKIVAKKSTDDSPTRVKKDTEKSIESNDKKVVDDAGDSRKESSSEDEEKKAKVTEFKRKRDDTSEDNTDEDDKKKKGQIAKVPLSRATSRRKHRDKYRDSSNSDSGESEEEPKRTKRNVAEEEEEEEEDSDSKKIQDDSQNIVETKEDQENSRTCENRPETPLANEAPTDTKKKIIDNDKITSNEETERFDETVATSVSVTQSQNNYKPAKVNLKRSFAARPSVETLESKKDATENDVNDLANQDKENHASSDQIDAKSIPKRRRWGTILTPTDPTPAFTVSTDSLKVLVPGAKPLPINEVRLSKDDDEERDHHSQREKRYSVGESGIGHKSREDGEKPKNSESKKDPKGDNHIASRRKISIVKDTHHAKSPSPPMAIPTNILLIKNLVRPFTLNQIRELLSRTGTIVENGFWMDRIKSKCFVEYVNEDQAFETRQALHGISWPVSNPKKLQVEYATKEEMELARELSKDQPTSRKTEPLAANDGWQQDWARDERTNATTKVTVVREWDLGKEDDQHFAKDKERDKKEIEKKRRQRSRSPTLETHLPAPARKFKKKEDDPPPAKLLDDLFRKTKATPCIYWLPLTNEQIVVKEEMRRQHMAEHARRLEEMRRAERNRDGRRRRSPRK